MLSIKVSASKVWIFKNVDNIVHHKTERKTYADNISFVLATCPLNGR